MKKWFGVLMRFFRKGLKNNGGRVKGIIGNSKPVSRRIINIYI
jgi:hypothetical protein